MNMVCLKHRGKCRTDPLLDFWIHPQAALNERKGRQAARTHWPAVGIRKRNSGCWPMKMWREPQARGNPLCVCSKMLSGLIYRGEADVGLSQRPLRALLELIWALQCARCRPRWQRGRRGKTLCHLGMYSRDPSGEESWPWESESG